MFFAVYPEHFRCDIVHSFDMGRWNCWRSLRFCYRFNVLLCGECKPSRYAVMMSLLKKKFHLNGDVVKGIYEGFRDYN